MEDRPILPKTPQEKKAHSYARDRRYCYGENHKAARRAVPRRKAGENRDDRRKVAQCMTALAHRNEATAALAESSARHGINRIGGWRKSPDLALGTHVGRQAIRRDQVRTRHGPAASGAGRS